MRQEMAVIVLGLFALPGSAYAQFTIKSEDGKNSLKFGLLSQARAEWLDTADGMNTSQDLYLRRLRVLLGGKLGDKISFFVETDAPNLGKAAADGTKNASDVFVQDAFVTYTFASAIALDAGMLLTPNSHNTQQGATTLLPIDYGAYSFLHSTPTGSRTGRDYGLQARGYLFKNHLEYRAGVFQGARGTDSRNPFRGVARVVFYPLDAETGFFYSGTNFGKKKIVALGASYDQQKQYHATGVDLYVDLPLGRGAFTLQGDLLHYNGGTFLTQLPKQNTYLLESSYYVSALKLGPFVQFARRDYAAQATPDEQSLQLGVSFWQSGHQFNLKLGWAHLKKDGAPDRDQVLLQCQLYVY